MKVIYFTHTIFQDSDLPYISIQKDNIDDFYVFVDGLKTDGFRSIIDLRDAPPYPCVCKSTKLKSYRRIIKLINPERIFLLNRVKGYWWHPYSLVVSIIFLFKILWINPDVIHIVDYVDGYFKFLYLFKKKLVLTVHDPKPHSSFINNKNYLKQRNELFQHCNNFIILNNEQKSEFINTYSLQNKNVFVNSLGVYNFMELFSDDTKTFPFPYILFWGQIQEHKGIDSLLDAMIEVHKKHPETHLVIAGKGTVSFSIEEFEKNDYIHFIKEYLSMDAIASLIRSSLFVVCPYKDATQSGVVLTTFALAKPIIATNVGVLGKLIIDNFTGLLVEPNQPEELVNAINKLLDDTVLLADFSSNIRKEFLENGQNSWTVISQKYLEIYKQIIDSNER